jgi:hypothetical protein
MKPRLFPFAFAAVLLCTAAGADDSNPGRDGQYEFIGQVVEGTGWNSDVEEEGPVRVVFRQGGDSITIVRSLKNYMLLGKWKQSGDTICFPTRGGVFVGIVQGDRIIGDEITPEGDRRRIIWTKRKPNRDGPDK